MEEITEKLLKLKEIAGEKEFNLYKASLLLEITMLIKNYEDILYQQEENRKQQIKDNL